MKIFKFQGLDYYVIAPTKEVAVMTAHLNKWGVTEDNIYEVESIGKTPLKIISFIKCKKCGGHFKPSKGFVNYHNIQWQEGDSGAEFETKLEDVLKCQDCGHSFTFGEKDEFHDKRKEAISWWESLSNASKRAWLEGSDVTLANVRKIDSLTGREIQILHDRFQRKVAEIKKKVEDKSHSLDCQEGGWDLQTRIKYEDMLDDDHRKLDLDDSKWNLENDPHTLDYLSKPTKELVDFDSLKDIPHIFSAFCKKYAPHWNDKADNFQLFFKKLAKSSSFAHKAHKELKDKLS